MLCSRAKRLMVDYIDGGLSERTRLSVEKHIDVCPQCQKVQADIRSLNTLLSQVPEIEVPFGFSSRVLDKLRREEAAPSLLRWSPFRFLPIPWRAIILN